VSAVSETPSDPLLRVEHVWVCYDSLVAVRDLSFELRGGDLLGLIGPNGAGKTTLLRAIAGAQPLSAGRVQVLGHTVGPGTTALRHVGFAPDNPPVYEELTVRQFLTFIAMGYGLSRQGLDDHIGFWLEQVWLTEKADQKIKSLSRGMRQRIGIARTMLPNPQVVLLDEPAAGLDPAGRVQFRQLLCDLRDQGKALIVSSHILSDMNEYCTHIGIMSKGSIMQYGTVAQVAAAGNGEHCRYTLVLASPMPQLATILESIESVSNVRVERDHVTLQYPSSRQAAAALLARLVQENVPVASFTPHAPGLEEAYLRAGIEQVD
jgi:ABC-2 type transport system ATP-binding protein